MAAEFRTSTILLGITGIIIGIPPDSPERTICLVAGAVLTLGGTTAQLRHRRNMDAESARLDRIKQDREMTARERERFDRLTARSDPDPDPAPTGLDRLNAMMDADQEQDTRPPVPPGKTDFTPEELLLYFGDDSASVGSASLEITDKPMTLKDRLARTKENDG